MVGGEYFVENLEPTDVEIHFSILAQLAFQTRSLPDGSKIHMFVEADEVAASGSPPRVRVEHVAVLGVRSDQSDG